MNVFNTRADMWSAPSNLGSVVFLNELGREGLFILRSGSIPFVDDNQAIYVPSAAGGYWERVEKGPVNFLWCGAIRGDNAATDNWAQWIQAIRLCGASGRSLYVPAGRYRMKTAGLLDMTSFWTDGITIFGDGHKRSILDWRACTDSPNLTIFSSNNGSYFNNMRDIGIQGDIPGIVVKIGKDDFSDPPNCYNWDGVAIENYNTTDAARGAVLNFVVGSWFKWFVGCGSGGYVGGKGVALTLRQAEFCVFEGSMGSAEISVLFDGGHSFGNEFNAPDFENVKTCVRLKPGGTYENNTFIGGQWSYSTNGIDCQAGTRTVVINPKNTPNSPAVASNFVSGNIGYVQI